MHSDKKQNSTVDPQLKDYILQNRQTGATDVQIREALLQAGWPIHSVDQSFNGLGHSHTTTAPHPLGAAHHPGAAAHQPKKYQLFVAIGDGFRAANANAKGCLLVLLINLAIGSAVFIASVIVALIGVGIGFISASGGSPSVAGIVGLCIVGLLVLAAYVSMSAFMVTSFALAINDGAEGRQSDVGALVRHTFKILPHVVLAQLFMVAVIAAPILLFGGLLIAVGSAASSGPVVADGGFTGVVVAVVISIILGLAYIVWVILCSIVFALVPMVATFEVHLSLRKTLSRSRHLMKKGGAWFMVKAMLILTALQLSVIPFMDFSTEPTASNDFGASDGVAFIVSIASIPISLLCMTTLVVFYRNRVAVRG